MPRPAPFLPLAAAFLLAAAGAAAQPVATGTVIGPEGRPLAGARVELIPVLSGFEQGLRGLEGPGDPPPATVAATDGTGCFVLRADAPGIWKVVVRGAGAVPLQYVPLPLAEPLELPPAILSADAGARLLLLDAAGFQRRGGVAAGLSRRAHGRRRRPRPAPAHR